MNLSSFVPTFPNCPQIRYRCSWAALARLLLDSAHGFTSIKRPITNAKCESLEVTIHSRPSMSISLGSVFLSTMLVVVFFCVCTPHS